MKKILLVLLLLVVSFVNAQSYSHTPKTVATIPTDSLAQEIKILNPFKESVVHIVYRYRQGDYFWEEIGSVTIFPGMMAKFYVKKGFVYGSGEEGDEPKRLGPAAKKWKVKYKTE